MSGTRIYDRQILSEFINLYRANQCLWNKNSENYLNHFVRIKAYNILLKKLKEIDKFATIATVRTKINSLRTNFRHEWKKVEVSKKSGAIGHDIYQPTLWYFKKLSFLVDEHVPEVIAKEDKINKLSDLRSCPRSFILEFINLYRKHECLWNVDSKNYKNKIVNAKAYEALRIKCLEIDEEATIDLVKKKINSIRTNFFAYCKKITKTKESGLDESLQTKLYYFDHLKFLLKRNSEKADENKDARSVSPEENITKNSESLEENQRTRSESPENNNRKRSVSPEEQEEDKRKNSESSEENQRTESESPEPNKKNRNESSRENKRNRSESPMEYKLFENVEVEDLYLLSENKNALKSKRSASKSNTDINSNCQKRIRNYNHFDEENEDISDDSIILTRSKRSKPIKKIPKYKGNYDETEEDEFDIYAKYIASEIRTLPSDDLIFVKKLFNDTLFEAKLGNARCMRIMSNSKMQLTSDEICSK